MSGELTTFKTAIVARSESVDFRFYLCKFVDFQDENLAIRSLEEHQFNVDLTVDFITSLMLATADVVQPEIVKVEKNDVEVDNHIETNSNPVEIPVETEVKVDSHPKPKQKKVMKIVIDLLIDQN